MTDAGGLGTLAFGYLSAADAVERLAATRALTAGPFGVNVFVPGTPYADRDALEQLRTRLRADPLVPTEPGVARYDDDAFAAKVDLLVDSPSPSSPSRSGRRRPRWCPRCTTWGPRCG